MNSTPYRNREHVRPEAVARRIAAARTAIRHDMTVAELADSLGVDRSAWTKYEKGIRIMPAEIACKFAERYGVTMDFLYRGILDGIADQELRGRIFDALARTSSR